MKKIMPANTVCRACGAGACFTDDLAAVMDGWSVRIRGGGDSYYFCPDCAEKPLPFDERVYPPCLDTRG